MRCARCSRWNQVCSSRIEPFQGTYLEMPCVREERSPGVSILHISGPLRVPLSRDLELAVHAVLRRGVRRIELNLAAVSDLDAGGVGELVQCTTWPRARTVCCGSSALPRAFRDFSAKRASSIS